jgi:drug/metabolite transporter (DMT)-like permease
MIATHKQTHDKDIRAAHSKGILLIALSTITWSSGGLFVRLLPFELWTIMFWRGLFASIFIGAFLLYRFGKETFDVLRGIDAHGLLITLCSTASTIFFVASVQRTSVANAFTILAALPFVAAAIAWIWLRERPSGLTLLASVVALAGIVIMLKPTAGGPSLGDLLAILGTIAQAVMTVAIRRNPDAKISPIVWLSVFLTVIVALPLGESLWTLTPRDYVVAAGFGLIAVTLGQMLYMVGSTLIPASLTALIGTLEAPIAALWAWIGVGEIPATATFIGGSLVFGSVFGRLLVEQNRFDWMMSARR